MTAYEVITEQIIKKMQEGEIPWVKPWKNCKHVNSASMFPCYSYSNSKRYTLINQMLLEFEPGEYATFEQIKKAGGKVKKGEKSHIVCGWIVEDHKQTDKDGEVVVDDDGNPILKTSYALRYYRVFNILTQCEDIQPKLNWDAPETENDETEIQPVEAAENIVNRYINSSNAPTLTITYSDRAYYSPAEDKVVVPKPEQFKITDEFYSTLFHELTHSTMTTSRCDRKNNMKSAAFGSQDYSKEELVAEIGSCFLTNFSGLTTESTFRNSVAYLQSWLKALKDDPKMIVYASSQAEKAVEFILNA